MDVTSETIDRIFSSGGGVQYKLPHFQREYAWEKSHWKTLFDDVISVYDDSATTNPEHFLGAIVVIEDRTHNVSLTTYILVDGQQRLLTISLLLCALRSCCEKDPKLQRSLSKYLLNPDEDGELYYKIVPTEKYADREIYFSVLSNQPVEQKKSQIVDAYHYFKDRIERKAKRNEIDPAQLYNCILRNLQVVFIKLKRDEQPYKIFESLNAKGKPLTQADLVRNYIAMRLPIDDQEMIFDRYWMKIESLLQDKRKVSGIGELTAFLRHYLAYTSGSVCNKNHVYARFRDRMEQDFSTKDEFINEIENIYRFAGYYNKLLRPKNEPDDNVQEQLHRLNIMESATSYPLLLFFYDFYAKKEISRDDFYNALKAVENFLVRRFLVGGSTTGLNRLFPSIKSAIQSAPNSKSLEHEISNRRMYPSDYHLRQNLRTNGIYDGSRQPRLVLVLDSLNKHLSKDSGGHTVLDDKATIEHIMPQKLNEGWQGHIGRDWPTVHNDYLHVIGNLTIVTQEWNSALSDSNFSKKKRKLAEHGLLLNKHYFSKSLDRWGSEAIDDRTWWLTDLILQVWPALGSAPRSEGVTGKKPLTLTIRDKRFPVKTWKGMVMQMVNCLHDMRLLTDYLSAQRHFGRWIVHDPSGAENWYAQSSMGWWINSLHSANEAAVFCERLADYCGLRDEEWRFTDE